MNGQKKVSNIEWWLVIGALATVDIIQAFLDFLAIGLAANRFIDVFVGLSFGLYLLLRGQMDSNAFIALLATFFGEEIPVVDVLPFWCLDGYYSMRRARAREAMEEQMEQEEMYAAAEKANSEKQLQYIQSQNTITAETNKKAA